jgi:hypothetical protein
LLPFVQESWDNYKNKRMLELSKRRWPEAKVGQASVHELRAFFSRTVPMDRCQKHLRLLSNGCSIILSAVGQAPRPASSLCSRDLRPDTDQ